MMVGMKASQIIGTVLDAVIKIVAIVVVVMFTYKYALEAYDFGYRVFAEEPVSSAEAAKTISISITEDATVMDIGEVLEEKGLIKNARLFWVQELLSGHHDELRPGIYELSSDMTSDEMIKIITAEPVKDEDAAATVENDSDTGVQEDIDVEGVGEEGGDTAEGDQP